MEKSPLLRRALWANVVFAELGAIAFLFLGNKLPFLDELTNGNRLVFGVELLVMAGLATYAALRATASRRLILAIVALNALLFGYYIEILIWGPPLSALATEVLLIDTMIVAALIVAQILGLRAAGQKKVALAP
ncbi:hypothetical protein GCM10027347_04760 [Larkinella harenae]